MEIPGYLWWVLGFLVWVFGMNFVYNALKNKKPKFFGEEVDTGLTAFFWPMSLPIWGVGLIVFPILQFVGFHLWELVVALILKPVIWLVVSTWAWGGSAANSFFPPKKRGRPKGSKNKK